MQINHLGNYTNGKKIVLLSKNNPFKKGSLQYYLLSFVIKNYMSLSKYTSVQNNSKLLKFLGSQKEPFFIDCWNGSKLFDAAISLSVVHNIIKMSKTMPIPCFGLFAEDGLFDIIDEPLFTNQLKKVPQTENIKLLWLSLYLNHKVRKDNHVPHIQFQKKDFSYSEKKFNITISNVPYHKIYDSVLELPLSAFSDCWYSEDWIALNSRGLFHHIGDHIGFFYGAKSVGQCYFLGRDQSNHLVTLSTDYKFNEIETNLDSSNNYYKLFAHVHPTDFKYVYGVPKGNPALFNDPMLISSEVEDCQQNNYNNVVSAEHFWNNSVFMKNSQRKMFVGSIEDKLIDILNNIKDLLSPKQVTIVDKIIQNKTISKPESFELILSLYQFSDTTLNEINQRSSFFMKSLAHKTVCEIINPIENLELGFFMKHNGSKPKVKTLFIFDLLVSSCTARQRTVKKPLSYMKEKFIKTFLQQDLEYVNVWSADDKKGFLFSELVSMKNEYRMFIINNRVVATSACFRNTVPLNAWQNGRFDPRLVNGHNDQNTHINRERVAKYAKFARHFTQQMQAENPQCHSYVLDVAWCEEKNTVVPIEINSISWSGAYQVNMHRVCAATLNKPFYYNQLSDFLSDKCDIWLDLIKDNIIENSMFDLCGLDRTLNGKTLQALSDIIQITIDNISQNLIDNTSQNLIDNTSQNLTDNTLQNKVHEQLNSDIVIHIDTPVFGIDEHNQKNSIVTILEELDQLYSPLEDDDDDDDNDTFVFNDDSKEK